MGLSAAQLVQLKTELQTDPTAIGYATDLANRTDHKLAEAVNLVRLSITVKRKDVSARELYEAIEVTDYTALPGSPTAAQLSAERRYLGWLTGLIALDRVRLQNDDNTVTPVGANLQAMFAGGTGTRTRITALMTRTGSRAEQLFGVGTVVTVDDVSTALE